MRRQSQRSRHLTGAGDLRRALADVARLRIEVFREWPYLYDGSLDYEQTYLAGFARRRDAVDRGRMGRRAYRRCGDRCAARPGTRAEFAPLFAAHGIDPERVFYCGESVLLPAYRGSGVGQAFFDQREAACPRLHRMPTAPSRTLRSAASCAPPTIRAVPAGYQPLDAFWTQARLSRRVAGLIGRYAWKEIGAAAETRSRCSSG